MNMRAHFYVLFETMKKPTDCCQRETFVNFSHPIHITYEQFSFAYRHLSEQRTRIKKTHKTLRKTINAVPGNHRDTGSATRHINIVSTCGWLLPAGFSFDSLMYAYTLWKITSELVIIIKITIQLPCTETTAATKAEECINEITAILFTSSRDRSRARSSISSKENIWIIAS